MSGFVIVVPVRMCSHFVHPRSLGDEPSQEEPGKREREGGREGKREGERERRREGKREGEREGGREGEREGGREGETRGKKFIMESQVRST